MATQKEIEALEHGDRVRNVESGNCYVVVQKYYRECGRAEVVAVRTVVVSNCAEWGVVKRHSWNPPPLCPACKGTGLPPPCCSSCKGTGEDPDFEVKGP